MTNIIILCDSLITVAQKILECEIPHEKVFCFQTATTPEYLIISTCPSIDIKKEIPLIENYPRKTSSIKDIYPICYSIKKSDLDHDDDKYKKLAELILSLKYHFTQAKEITDSYNEEYLVLYN